MQKYVRENKIRDGSRKVDCHTRKGNCCGICNNYKSNSTAERMRIKLSLRRGVA